MEKELTACNPMTLLNDQENIDYFIPAAYYRQPLPLQEACVRYVVDDDVSGGGGGSSSRVAVKINASENFTFYETKTDRKDLLLKGLVGQPEYCSNLTSAATEPFLETAASRLNGTHCNASRVKSAPLMVQLVSLIMSSRTTPAREGVGCITSIDLSHTVLGTVGPKGPPLRFDALDNAQWSEHGISFFPDEMRKGRKMRQSKLDDFALRSLAFTYVAPLLWVPGIKQFQLTALVCRHCCLQDQDAKALALILRKRPSSRHRCMLKHIDLSYNRITDHGAEALKKALKYNRCVERLNLTGNKCMINMQIIETIERRLEHNRNGKRNWTVFQHIKWMLRGH